MLEDTSVSLTLERQSCSLALARCLVAITSSLPCTCWARYLHTRSRETPRTPQGPTGARPYL